MPPRQIGLKRFITQIIILAPIRHIHSYLSMQYTPLEKPNKSSARANLVSRVAKLISVSFRFIIGLLDCLLTAHYGAHQIPNFWYQILSVNFPATFLCKKKKFVDNIWHKSLGIWRASKCLLKKKNTLHNLRGKNLGIAIFDGSRKS